MNKYFVKNRNIEANNLKFLKNLRTVPSSRVKRQSKCVIITRFEAFCIHTHYIPHITQITSLLDFLQLLKLQLFKLFMITHLRISRNSECRLEISAWKSQTIYSLPYLQLNMFPMPASNWVIAMKRINSVNSCG